MGGTPPIIAASGRLRRATVRDLPFLAEVGWYAAHWRPDAPPPPAAAEVRSRDQLGRVDRSIQTGPPAKPVRPDGRHRKRRRRLAEPRLGRYLAGWGRAGDAGVLALDERDQPIGAAWYRLFAHDQPGYGFLAESIPELSIAVRPSFRGRGVGTALLNALVRLARDEGHAALSLSVEPDNPARKLYERVGFRKVGSKGGSWTMRLDLAVTPDLIEFVRAELPAPPARVLEVGCGEGELGLALDAAGYDVLAIDPVAPDGPIFRRTTIEELAEPGPFDAVVASRALHHVHDLDAVLAKIAGLAPLLVLDEFVWDRFDQATARWYDEQRVRSDDPPPPAAEWRRRHAHLHGFEALRAALARRFVERKFSPVPYLHRYMHVPELESREAELIEAGEIQALGFRFVGTPRD
jgi:GNAT superfamily N-acetyltransferase